MVRIYRMLYNPLMYWIAYRNLHPDSQTAGADKTCMDPEMTGRIEGIIGFMRRQKYRPVSRTKIYDTHRVSEDLEQRRDREISDRLVEEALRVILTGVYEPVFRVRAEKFQLGCLEDVPDSGWLVEGEISPRLDPPDYHILCDSILRRRIKEEKIISLVWGFLKAGYMEQWEVQPDGTEVPHGLAAILWDIYLGELDQYAGELIDREEDSLEPAWNRIRYIRENGRFTFWVPGHWVRALHLWDGGTFFLRKQLNLPNAAETVQITEYKS